MPQGRRIQTKRRIVPTLDAFVAHEDIEPSLEWQREIEIALRSMHALVALITSDFHASEWTDQEVGWAFGRSLPVIPAFLGVDPYGFVGKLQGVSGSLDKTYDLAYSIIDALLINHQTHGEMRRALVSAFAEATSYSMAIAISKHVVKVTDFTEEEKDALKKACKENSQVAGAFGVSDVIYNSFGKPPAPKEKKTDDVPF